MINSIIFVLIIALFKYSRGKEAQDEFEYYKRKYQEKFDQQCRKYEFVLRYEELMKSLPSRYMIFVFHENGYYNGGLGDRLGGLITAVAYSLRYKRMLLIQGDKAFGDYFQPLYFANSNDSEHNWNNWAWSGWKEEFFSQMAGYHCVNPKPRKTYCAIDRDLPEKVIKYFGNRAYLCRWLAKRDLNLGSELYDQLKLDLQSNLYEAAGCMLRLVMHPTQHLWESYLHIKKASMKRHSVFRSGADLNRFMQEGHHERGLHGPTHFQVGIHFRCGDSSFRSRNQSPNPRCVVIPNTTWEGTFFGDAYSMDSPIDLARCAQTKIDHYVTGSKEKHVTDPLAHAAVYIASDNRDSSSQMAHHIQPQTTIIHPHGSCHIDLKKDEDCLGATMVQWFLLAMSDVIITQPSLEVQKGSMYSDSPDQEYLTKSFPEQIGPVSAFSRYAILYGLNTESFHFGNCTTINSTLLAHTTHGNWVCNPRTFF